MRILVAEDDITSRMMLCSILTKWDYDVVEAVDGEGAWNILRHSGAPRLALLDWVMPGMDGLEIVKRVRAMGVSREEPKNDTAGGPYMIMVTSRDQKHDIISALDAGADDYLTKPFDPGELRARVGVGIRILEMQEQLESQVRELTGALEHIRKLQGILPICASCKKIRDDKGSWTQIEAYIRDHSEAQFSHGLCPECAKKLYPEFSLDREQP